MTDNYNSKCNNVDNDSCEDFEEEYEDYYDDTGNMPCDTYGPAACSPSCSNYPRCQGWVK